MSRRADLTTEDDILLLEISVAEVRAKTAKRSARDREFEAKGTDSIPSKPYYNHDPRLQQNPLVFFVLCPHFRRRPFRATATILLLLLAARR